MVEVCKAIFVVDRKFPILQVQTPSNRSTLLLISFTVILSSAALYKEDRRSEG